PAPRTSPALKPNPPVARAFPERRPDFVGLIGVAFFLLIVGIVFTLNTNLLNDLRFWWDLLVANGLFVRPPDGIIASGTIFFGLLGLSNFLTSGLRWTLDRSRFGALARVLAGVGFISLAFLTWRYSLRAMSGSLVISVWTAILGTFLVIYIAVGLYWVRARRPAPTGARVPTSRPYVRREGLSPPRLHRGPLRAGRAGMWALPREECTDSRSRTTRCWPLFRHPPRCESRCSQSRIVRRPGPPRGRPAGA